MVELCAGRAGIRTVIYTILIRSYEAPTEAVVALNDTITKGKCAVQAVERPIREVAGRRFVSTRLEQERGEPDVIWRHDFVWETR